MDAGEVEFKIGWGTALVAQRRTRVGQAMLYAIEFGS